MKALVVEDEPVSAQLLRAMLLPFGPVAIANSGEQAIGTYAQTLDSGHGFDVVFFDIMMPGLSGQEALIELRHVEEARGLFGNQRAKVIMVTALDDTANLYSAHAAGCIDYLVKPLSRARLLKALNRIGLALPDA